MSYSPEIQVSILRGIQCITKFRKSSELKDIVFICMALIRIPSVAADIVITLNDAVVSDVPIQQLPEVRAYIYASIRFVLTRL